MICFCLAHFYKNLLLVGINRLYGFHSSMRQPFRQYQTSVKVTAMADNATVITFFAKNIVRLQVLVVSIIAQPTHLKAGELFEVFETNRVCRFTQKVYDIKRARLIPGRRWRFSCNRPKWCCSLCPQPEEKSCRLKTLPFTQVRFFSRWIRTRD